MCVDRFRVLQVSSIMNTIAGGYRIAYYYSYMSYPLPPNVSKREINRAGEILADPNATQEEIERATELVNQWRACHGYPINTFQATLRLKVKPYKGAIVAQRLKRLPTIIDKRRRYPTMKLAQMQDIGGVRAILPKLSNVRELRDLYMNKIRFGHELLSPVDDYIEQPRWDGYRSIHLIYRYKNNDSPYNGLILELQLRTKLQHLWATAVETTGTFKGQALKSREGDAEWLKFFAVTSSAFAWIEGTTLVPNYEKLSKKETYKAVATAEAKLKVLDQIASYSSAMHYLGDHKDKKSSYHLLILDSTANTIEIRSYARDELQKASSDYEEVERNKNVDVVLVSAGPMEQLRRAYPNFFLDVHEFVKTVKAIIEKSKKEA